MKGLLQWFRKSDLDLEEIQTKTDHLVRKVEESLPKISGESICDSLRTKPRTQWTDNERRLWNKHGCR
jgi:Protein of unknown function (DUF3012)